MFCNGLELCADLGSCQPATDPCAPLLCDEGSTSCLSLLHVSNLEVFYAGKFSDQGDPSKSFLAVGSAATLANVTHYAGGISGVRVTFDAIVTFATTPEAAFTFEWTTGSGTTFSAVTDVATNVTVTPTVIGTETVVDIVLADGHVVGRWLKITIDATQITASGGELDGELTGHPTPFPGGDGVAGGGGGVRGGAHGRNPRTGGGGRGGWAASRQPGGVSER